MSYLDEENKTVTITLTRGVHYAPYNDVIKTGEVVNLSPKKKYKRFCLVCIKGGISDFQFKIAYKPSPKSQLRRINSFTKTKCKIIL